MPLSPPAPRKPLHRRTIDMVGYHRDDGLYDIEAHLVDTKTYAFDNQDRGTIEVGEPLHGMLARMTIDDDMLIIAFEAATDFSPYAICPQAAPNFARLAGIRIGRGFIRAANERIGGVHGCTHLRELLGQMGTVAFQTMYSIRQKRDTAPNAVSTPAVPASTSGSTPASVPAPRPPMLGTCLAYAPESPVVQRHWPGFYTGPAIPPSSPLPLREGPGVGEGHKPPFANSTNPPDLNPKS